MTLVEAPAESGKPQSCCGIPRKLMEQLQLWLLSSAIRKIQTDAAVQLEERSNLEQLLVNGFRIGSGGIAGRWRNKGYTELMMNGTMSPACARTLHRVPFELLCDTARLRATMPRYEHGCIWLIVTGRS